MTVKVENDIMATSLYAAMMNTLQQSQAGMAHALNWSYFSHQLSQGTCVCARARACVRVCVYDRTVHSSRTQSAAARAHCLANGERRRR